MAAGKTFEVRQFKGKVAVLITASFWEQDCIIFVDMFYCNIYKLSRPSIFMQENEMLLRKD